ncbi:MAG: hypothetical protein WB816_03635 [Methylocystis sp.]
MSNAYVTVMEPETARRQFRLSVTLVAAMALAACVLGFATPIPQTGKVTITNDDAPFSGRLVSLIDE